MVFLEFERKPKIIMGMDVHKRGFSSDAGCSEAGTVVERTQHLDAGSGKWKEQCPGFQPHYPKQKYAIQTPTRVQ